MRSLRRLVAIAVAALVAGCTSYQPLPLDTAARAPLDPGDVRVDAATMPLPELRRHRFDPRDGLDMTEVAMLAVANNPELRIARDKLGVARAQAFAAGLLPDPVLAISEGFPLGAAAAVSAFDLALSADVRAVLARPTATQSVAAKVQRIDLDLLWKEWQIVGEARRLFVRARYEQRAVALLVAERSMLAEQHSAISAASRHGDVAERVLADDRVALEAILRQLAAMRREQLATAQSLRALLGLSARAELDLVGPVTLPSIDDDAASRGLAALPARRPDLLALQAGYRSEDLRYRQAILEQFPALGVGVQRSRDTGGTNTRGLAISITLPLFNRNRGHIAIERATRTELHDEYALRLEHARAEVGDVLADRALLLARHDEIEGAIATSTNVQEAASQARVHGDLSEAAYLRIETPLLAARLDLAVVDRNLQDADVALLTLLGVPPAPRHGRGPAR